MNKFSIMSSMLLGIALSSLSLKAQDANWSVDLIAGSSYIVSTTNSDPSPMGGVGVRYSISKALSAQLQVGGGVFSGRHGTSDALYRHNYLQYSFRALVNPVALIAKRNFGRLNPYLYVGAGHVQCYNTQTYHLDQRSYLNKFAGLFYVANAGAKVQFYMNEHIDLVAGAEMNMSSTTMLDNDQTGPYDNFLTGYGGLTYKLISGKKQSNEWSHIQTTTQSYDALLRTAELRAADAEAKLHALTVESQKKEEEANTRVARAEAMTSQMISQMGGVHARLDSIKTFMAVIDKKMIDNKPSASPEQKAVPAFPGSEIMASARPQHLSGVVRGPQADDSDVTGIVSHNGGIGIVLGSYAKKQNAINARKALTEKGFSVEVVDYINPELHRLVLYSGSLPAARKHLNDIREKEQPDAWLLLPLAVK
jgi:hypothetical protein